MLGQRRWSFSSTAGSMERRHSCIPRWLPSKDPHCWPTTMRSSETRTGRAYRTCSAASRQKIPSKWENLELDSTPFTTSQVRILYICVSKGVDFFFEHQAKVWTTSSVHFCYYTVKYMFWSLYQCFQSELDIACIGQFTNTNSITAVAILRVKLFHHKQRT